MTTPWTPEEWRKIILDSKQIYFKNKGDIENSVRYSQIYLFYYTALIKEIAEKISEKIFHGILPKDIALFSFGSPARHEMLGESDVDCLVIRRKNTPQSTEFRKQLSEELGKYDFSKIDIPDWGTIEDCETFLKTAITEGNQIIEARYFWGDSNIEKEIWALRRKYCTIEKFEVTLVFQYLYFNQYYVQRGREGQLNLKYGNGGTRDFMFPVWLSNIRDGLEFVNKQDESAALKAIDSLYLHKDMIVEDRNKYRTGVNVITYFRDKLLQNNRKTDDDGKTFINKTSISRLYQQHKEIFRNIEELEEYISFHVKSVYELKELTWKTLLEYFKKEKSVEWNNLLDSILANHKIEDLSMILKDETLCVLLIWLSDIVTIEQTQITKLLETDKWSVLTSIACHPNASPEILHTLSTKYGVKKGYEYILKVCARNKNTPIETLKKIAENPDIEYRFKEPAIIRLKKGYESANQL
jgi:predicted nucleotidyltransferase